MTKIKKSVCVLTAACAMAFAGGFAAMKAIPADAAVDASAFGYYGKKLAEDANYKIAAAFYKELVAMATDPDGEDEQKSALESGTDYSVSEVAILNEVANYANGIATLQKQFGAALDCFRYDNPDLFWIDFDRLTFNVTEETTSGEETTKTYKVEIGKGRSTSYFLYDLTPESLSGTDGLIAKYNTALDGLAAEVTTALGGDAAGKTAQEKATAVNKVLYGKYMYGYNYDSNDTVTDVERFVKTAYSIVPPSGNKSLADSEGMALAYKAVMNKLGVADCEIVSGYYNDGNAVRAWKWNYVSDEGKNYAVDLAGNLVSGQTDRYVWTTGETFFLNHFENKVVSLSKYNMSYPDLSTNLLSVDTGELQLVKSEHDGKEAVKVTYASDNAYTLKISLFAEGTWGDWLTFDEYINPATSEEPADGEAPAEPKGFLDTENKAAYFYGLTEGGFRIGVFNGETLVETGKTVQEKEVVPVALVTNDPRSTVHKISAEPTDVQITYGSAAGLKASGEVTVDYTVTSFTGGAVNEAEVKANCKVTEVNWTEGTGILTFKFTPSNLAEHSGLCYSFTPNLATDDGKAPKAYSLVFGTHPIVAEQVYGGSTLYTDIVGQPSLVFNNNFSLAGWKYDGNAAVLENMRSALVVNATRPTAEVQTKINQAVSVEGSALKKTEFYNVSLTMDGKAVTIPQNTYLKLAFPYPQDYGPDSNDEVTYKLFHFKYAADGTVDYANPEILPLSATRQGLVGAVDSMSVFAVAVIEGAANTEKTVLLQTTGVGGTVQVRGASEANTGKPVVILKDASDYIELTFTPDDGYELAFVSINGKKVELTNNKCMIAYGQLRNEDASPSFQNVVQVEFKLTGTDIAVAESFANGFTKDTQLATTPYGPGESGQIITDYPSGIVAPKPNGDGSGNNPADDEVITASTKTQLIVVLSILIGASVIGAIVLLYCVAIRPKILREREEEAARIAANRERRANRNRVQPGSMIPRDPKYPPKK